MPRFAIKRVLGLGVSGAAKDALMLRVDSARRDLFDASGFVRTVRHTMPLAVQGSPRRPSRFIRMVLMPRFTIKRVLGSISVKISMAEVNPPDFLICRSRVTSLAEEYIHNLHSVLDTQGVKGVCGDGPQENMLLGCYPSVTVFLNEQQNDKRKMIVFKNGARRLALSKIESNEMKNIGNLWSDYQLVQIDKEREKGNHVGLSLTAEGHDLKGFMFDKEYPSKGYLMGSIGHETNERLQ